MINFLKNIDYRFWILTLFVFTLPNSVAVNNILAGIIIFYWLIWGDKKETLKLFQSNPIVLLSFLFFFDPHNWSSME